MSRQLSRRLDELEARFDAFVADDQADQADEVDELPDGWTATGGGWYVHDDGRKVQGRDKVTP